MEETLKLLAVFAHPDDESLGVGGTLAKYAAEGVETHLVTATRGERGWFGPEDEYPGPTALGKIREGELRAAAEVLGLRSVSFLEYLDGELDRAEPTEAIDKIVTHIRRIRPHVVITFGPNGAYGHPDHIAICQFTTAAIVAAAGPECGDRLGRPHRVAKLYYMVETQEKAAAYQAVFGDLVMEVDGHERRPVVWEPWAVTTRVDTADHWCRVLDAITCHRSQLPGYQKLIRLPEEQHRYLWGSQEFYRAFSLVNGGRTVERDLFVGLRGR